MAKRKRVALIYAYSENWIGGTYYIENLIAALGQLPDNQQPMLLIFTADAMDAERLQQAVQYPYWLFRRFERTLWLPKRAINKITSILFERRFINTLYSDIDIVFPLRTNLQRYFSRVRHHLYWIPDFQEHYLPAFFKPDEINERKADQQLILEQARHVVFSSYSAQHDFNEIYPGSKLAQHVLQFAVTSRSALEKEEACLARYDIEQPYFLCSNQFWKHKNHPTVLRALAELQLTYPQALVVFTGKEHDYRNPMYFEELSALRDKLNLQEKTRFLGFIPREDQLVLMRAAAAVIQPSLFEGWSTVVEDAKSLNAPLLTSSLKVHEEQLATYEAKLFFSPEDASGLAFCMARVLKGELSPHPYDYQHDVVRFAMEFVRVIEHIVGK